MENSSIAQMTVWKMQKHASEIIHVHCSIKVTNCTYNLIAEGITSSIVQFTRALLQWCI